LKHLIYLSAAIGALALSACGGGGSSPLPIHTPIQATPTPSPAPSKAPQVYTVTLSWTGGLGDLSNKSTAGKFRIADDGTVVETPPPVLVSTNYAGEFTGTDAIVSVGFSPQPSASPSVAYADSSTMSTLDPAASLEASPPADSIGVLGGTGGPGPSTITTNITSPVTATVPVQVSTYVSAALQCEGSGGDNPAFQNPIALIFNNNGTVTTTQDPTVADLYITGPSDSCTGAFATAEGSNFELTAPGGLTLLPLQTSDFESISAAQFVAGQTSYQIPTDGPGISNFKDNTVVLLQTRMGIYVKLAFRSTSSSGYGIVGVPAIDVANTSGVFTF
jgi:hypothetical protein